MNFPIYLPAIMIPLRYFIIAGVFFSIFYYYRNEQRQRITEPMDKSNIEGLNIFYSYIVSFLLVMIVVASAIMARG